MSKELIQEKLAHLETRRALWQVQQQLLALLQDQSRGEAERLQAELSACPDPA